MTLNVSRYGNEMSIGKFEVYCYVKKNEITGKSDETKNEYK